MDLNISIVFCPTDLFCFKMFFVFFLPDLNQNKVVKATWIKSIPVKNMCKNSINANIVHTVFLSNNEEDEADFTLPIQKTFCGQPSCFIGFMIKCFGNLI